MEARTATTISEPQNNRALKESGTAIPDSSLSSTHPLAQAFRLALCESPGYGMDYSGMIRMKDIEEEDAHVARQDRPRRDERPDQERTLFRLPVSSDVCILRVDEPSGLCALDASPVSRGDGTCAEVLRLYPSTTRPCAAADDRAAG